MMRAGVAYDVMVERVRRMPDLPHLGPTTITRLTDKGVPDSVLLALVRRKRDVVPCEIPEPRVDTREVLDHPAIWRARYEVDAGVATKAIVAGVGQMETVPVLDGRAISRLTNKGVPDEVLLALVRKQEVLTGCDRVRAELLAASAEVRHHGVDVIPALSNATLDDSHGARKPARRARTPKDRDQTASHRLDASAAQPTGRGRVVVVAKSSLPVTYLEVLLDGQSVTSKGKVFVGEGEPGWQLQRPLVLDLKGGIVVFESELPTGSYAVQAAFAVAKIISTDEKLVRARVQRYDTTTAGPTGEDGEVPVCKVREDSTCVVVVRLLRRNNVHIVAYDSRAR